MRTENQRRPLMVRSHILQQPKMSDNKMALTERQSVSQRNTYRDISKQPMSPPLHSWS